MDDANRVSLMLVEEFGIYTSSPEIHVCPSSCDNDVRGMMGQIGTFFDEPDVSRVSLKVI